MIDYNKPIQMKSGEPVEILSTTLMGEYPILGKIKHSNSSYQYALWKNQGTCLPGEGAQKKDELENVKKERTVWLNVYPNNIAAVHPTRKVADEIADNRRIARIKVTFKEGRFDI